MVRIVFVAVEVDGGCAPRVLRRLRPRVTALGVGLCPVRHPPARRMFRTLLHADLPMRSGWLKPVHGGLPGLMWSTWWMHCGIRMESWLLDG